MLIDRHENIGTDTPTFYVNHAGHMVMRFTVVSDNGARRAYEMVIEGRMKLVHEEWPERKGLPVKMNMTEGGS